MWHACSFCITCIARLYEYVYLLYAWWCAFLCALCVDALEHERLCVYYTCANAEATAPTSAESSPCISFSSSCIVLLASHVLAQRMFCTTY